MSDDSIELYKPWDPDKAEGNIYFLSRKLDGVPVRIRKLSGRVFAWSRQNELITSISHIIPHVEGMLAEGGSIIGELYVEGMPFKDISGLVRRKESGGDTQKLVLNVFDFDLTNSPETPYAQRWKEFKWVYEQFMAINKIEPPATPVRLMPHIICRGPDAVEAAFKAIMDADPKAEGAVAHSISKPFQPGTRRWDTMKLKPRDSLDVEVLGYEESMDKYGRPKAMVGGVLIRLWQYQDGKLVDTRSKVGPGRMTMRERKAEWAKFKSGDFRTRLAEVSSMPDDTYDGLREGTWQRWRDDKDTHDVRQRKVA